MAGYLQVTLTYLTNVIQWYLISRAGFGKKVKQSFGRSTCALSLDQSQTSKLRKLWTGN